MAANVNSDMLKGCIFSQRAIGELIRKILIIEAIYEESNRVVLNPKLAKHLETFLCQVKKQVRHLRLFYHIGFRVTEVFFKAIRFFITEPKKVVAIIFSFHFTFTEPLLVTFHEFVCLITSRNSLFKFSYNECIVLNNISRNTVQCSNNENIYF